MSGVGPERLAARTREWDASTYDRVSEPQLAWGRVVLGRLELRGSETVIDAGCGSGRVTALLEQRLPEGRVIAVDASEAMLERARERLGERAELVHSDLLELELGPVADAVFSTATFHWIRDHERLFRRLAACMRPRGRLEAQCGGSGNVADFFAIVSEVAAREPYAPLLGDAPSSHTYFAGPEETEARLRAAGFTAVSCWLEPADTRPPEPRAFIENVCLRAHLAQLPPELRDRFADDVYAAWGAYGVLDYVRLNISARLPAG